MRTALLMEVVVAAMLVSVSLVAAGESPKAAAESPKEALPFIADDYARAVREATQNKLPIFVDAWAPW